MEEIISKHYDEIVSLIMDSGIPIDFDQYTLYEYQDEVKEYLEQNYPEVYALYTLNSSAEIGD